MIQTSAITRGLLRDASMGSSSWHGSFSRVSCRGLRLLRVTVNVRLPSLPGKLPALGAHGWSGGVPGCALRRPRLKGRLSS